jgi:hypothetical protein
VKDKQENVDFPSRRKGWDLVTASVRREKK